MNRRELIGAGVGLGAVILTADVAIAQPHPASDPKATLLAALADCIAKGVACNAHCQTQLAQGNKDFVHCASAVADMLAIVSATQSLVSRTSPTSKKLVDVCAAACRECSNACLEHKAHWAHGMHMECKACNDACLTCVTACQGFA
jgi:Cys-rich four helix bundle protein (predicted Tat secretion target)